MIYRIYVNGNNDYYDLGTYTVEQTISNLNWLILEQQTKEKVLVIECNIEDYIEFPVFIYNNKKEDYQKFKNYLLDNNKSEKVTKQYKKKI